MRCISGLYFILRIMPFMVKLITQPLSKYHAFIHWYYAGTLFFATALTVGIAKPYKKAYMNYLDTLILSNLAFVYYNFVSGAHMLQPIRILLETPIAAFIIVMVLKIIYFAGRPLSKCTCFKLVMRMIISMTSSREEEQQFTIDSPTAEQPLIEQTSTVLGYGACVNNQ